MTAKIKELLAEKLPQNEEETEEKP